MARVCSSPKVKYSTIRNNGSPTFCNLHRQDIRDIGKETIYPRWKSSIPKPKLVPFEKTATQRELLSDLSFDAEQILHRTPRLVRGWYLGKEPLEYRRQTTPFRFSFNTRNGNEATGEEDNEIKPITKRATLIYPECMTVTICTLQTRPVKQEKKLPTGTVSMPSAASKGKSTKAPTIHGLNKSKTPASSGLTSKKETFVQLDEDWKYSGRISKLTRKVYRQNERPRTAEFQEKKQIKRKNLQKLVTGFLSEGHECILGCGSESEQEKIINDYLKKIPDCCVECFTFKESDYDIWSRTSYD